MTRTRVGLIVAIAALFSGCRSHEAATPAKQYTIEGEILKVNAADQSATIKHQEIKGWMGAMTMDYPIRSREDFQKLHAGDRISGKVYVQGEDYSVGDIRIAPPPAGAKPDHP